MFKRLCVALISLYGLHAAADQSLILPVETVQQTIEQHFASQAQVRPFGLEDWVVGDTANYNLSMGFISGSMVMLIRESVEEGFWVDQDIDLGPFGKQKSESLIDKRTGKVLRLIVNGKEEKVPEDSPSEVVEYREEKITVPAGTFDSLYVKIKNKESGEISQAWINPAEIPLSGILKMIAPGQFGDVILELTAFTKL